VLLRSSRAALLAAAAARGLLVLLPPMHRLLAVCRAAPFGSSTSDLATCWAWRRSAPPCGGCSRRFGIRVRDLTIHPDPRPGGVEAAAGRRRRCGESSGRTPDIEPQAEQLPTRPGVYFFKDAAGEILYIGKAKSLRARVRSHFAVDPATSLKNREMLRRVADIDTIVVGSEAEALLLEANLIKEHRPRFNIQLRDDKRYPYIKVTLQEPSRAST
jgi:predicted GIY-YIG superfamily endonuclease